METEQTQSIVAASIQEISGGGHDEMTGAEYR
jgi:hypothetical protein